MADSYCTQQSWFSRMQEAEQQLKDPQLCLLCERIEELRGELNSLVAAGPGNLHSPRVYTLSTELDDLIVRFLRLSTVAEAAPAAKALAHVMPSLHSSRTEHHRRRDPERLHDGRLTARPGLLGLDGIGAIDWGAHLCHFYGTRQDLVDVLVPYFREGLRNNELCMWVTAEPLDDRGAREAMFQLVPEFGSYIASGQIEIISFREWYFRNGAFRGREVINAWLAQVERALMHGYSGLRATGNVAGFPKSEWGRLVEYEGLVHEAIGEHRITAVCSYPLDRCGPCEIIEVSRRHHAALLKQGTRWRLV